jgi:hypothetical protein
VGLQGPTYTHNSQKKSEISYDTFPFCARMEREKKEVPSVTSMPDSPVAPRTVSCILDFLKHHKITEFVSESFCIRLKIYFLAF